MPRDNHRIARAILLVGSVLIVAGCSDTDEGNRAATLASPAARRLNGSWQVSFSLDRNATLTPYAQDTSRLTGSIAFAEDNHGVVSADELASPTHDGAYDIDFSRFGFSTRTSGSFPEVIARVSVVGNLHGRPGADSVSIVLSPGGQLLTVRMTGLMAGDSIVGGWTASGYRSSGGAGRFVMHRMETH